MAGAQREAVISARVPAQSKVRLAELAAMQGLRESSLLALMVETVLNQNGAENLRHAEGSADADIAHGDRVTLRLRPGDRQLAEVRAAARGMKTASYLVALVHAHVRTYPPLPTVELRALKLAVAELSAMKRTFDIVQLRDAGIATLDLMGALHDTAARVDEVRRCVADVVRANLVSWEAADA